LSRIPIIAAAGSAFWHALLGVDRHNRPVTPVFTWADSRAAVDAAKLRRELDERHVQANTGCMLRAQFWPAKLRWLKRTNRALFRQVAQWRSPASWIFDNIFGVGRSSHSMASATGLYNLNAERWDGEMIDRCGIRLQQLDTIGDADRSTKRLREFRDATIFTAIGDGAASNIGSGADRQGSAAINYGTSGAVRVITSKAAARKRAVPFGLFQYVVDANRVVIGGAISNAGNLRQWCVRELHLPDERQALSRTAAAEDSLVVLPFLVGERSPDWPENLHGTFARLAQTTTATDLLRASETSTFYRLADIFGQIARQPASVTEVIVSGGILHSTAALHILADCLGRNIRISRELESSLRGAVVYSLQASGHDVPSLTPGKVVRHSRALAAKHRKRRADQRALQALLERAQS
jgi:gluconokinase